MNIFNKNNNDDDNYLLNNINNGLYRSITDAEPPLPEQKYKIWKILSLACFGLSFFFFALIPLNLLGIVFAIIYTCLSKRICWSGFLNVLGIVLFFVIIYMFFLNYISEYPKLIQDNPRVSVKIMDTEYNDNYLADFQEKIKDMRLSEIEAQISQLQGNWILIDDKDTSNIVKCTFNKDNSFSCFKYKEEEKTYAKGTYKVKSLSIQGKASNPTIVSDYEWKYAIETNINDCSINGVVQKNPITEIYNIEIFVNDGEYESEGFFTNSNKEYLYSGEKYK